MEGHNLDANQPNINNNVRKIIKDTYDTHNHKNPNGLTDICVFRSRIAHTYCLVDIKHLWTPKVYQFHSFIIALEVSDSHDKASKSSMTIHHCQKRLAL